MPASAPFALPRLRDYRTPGVNEMFLDRVFDLSKLRDCCYCLLFEVSVDEREVVSPSAYQEFVEVKLILMDMSGTISTVTYVSCF